MTQTDKKIVEGILRKAEALCPEVLDMIGVYGSAATGDIHDKSDLDLLILINDPKGYVLADGFVLEDLGVGYDMYCTTWESLEDDAKCGYGHISKLMDSKLLYVREDSLTARLNALREKAAAVLSSGECRERAMEAFDTAKKFFADCITEDSVSSVRKYSAAVISCILDAVILWNGRYFKRGVKRTFEELAELKLPFDIESLIMSVIKAEEREDIQNCLTELMKAVKNYLLLPCEKEAPSKDNIRRTYEEMYSNWRNKIPEAAQRGDLYSSFMNMASCQYMLDGIVSGVHINEIDIMAPFDPENLYGNAEAFDSALGLYLEEYRKAGLSPRRFANIDEYLKDYLKDI